MALSACSRPQNFDQELAAAESKMGLGDASAALRIYQDLANRYPEDSRRPVVLLRIADIYSTMLRDQGKALESYGRVIEEYPLSEASMLAHERWAERLLRQGDLDGAIQDYEAILKFSPDHPGRHRYHLLLGSTHLSRGSYGQAREELAPLIEDATTPPHVREQALFAMAESFFLQGRHQMAVDGYRLLLQQYPNSELAGEAKLHLATALEEMGRLGSAKRVAAQAREEYDNETIVDSKIEGIDKRGRKDVYK